jgi:arsenate reductase
MKKKILRRSIMSVLFINYPKCSTCVNARKWLEENKIDFESRHIVENNPTKEELKKFISLSGLPAKKFFNTSGILYREMNLKERLITATEDEMIEILSSNGMLVKRPLVITDKGVLIGFKKEKWEEFFK